MKTVSFRQLPSHCGSIFSRRGSREVESCASMLQWIRQGTSAWRNQPGKPASFKSPRVSQEGVLGPGISSVSLSRGFGSGVVHFWRTRNHPSDVIALNSLEFRQAVSSA